ncbi:MAG: DNA-protecting protein DprA [Asticcacaulis sp.]|nr:DNA-protecting protein DprA [Asticcacaulis sp.]
MAFDRIAAADTDAERFARLRLARSQRIGPIHFAQLMVRFGSAVRALEALPHVVGRSGGTFTAAPTERVEAEIKAGEAIGAHLLLAGDADYPALLAQIDAAPPVLWTLGRRQTISRKAVAIVGARNASAAGQKMAEALARDLGAAGFAIVSGMARGIDARAHDAALKTGTVAVLGGGVDDIYPPENADLYRSLGEQGLVVSESPVGYRAQARDFPRRNRIISGLSLATVVVEAELRSGSLITARLAAEQNREVFAVPGSPLDPRAKGCNDLLRNGANLCESAVDVMHALENQFGLSLPATADEPAPPEPRRFEDDIGKAGRTLLKLISPVPTSRDTLLRLSGLPPFVALSALSELEIAGRISAVDGGAYVLA